MHFDTSTSASALPLWPTDGINSAHRLETRSTNRPMTESCPSSRPEHARCVRVARGAGVREQETPDKRAQERTASLHHHADHYASRRVALRIGSIERPTKQDSSPSTGRIPQPAIVCDRAQERLARANCPSLHPRRRHRPSRVRPTFRLTAGPSGGKRSTPHRLSWRRLSPSSSVCPPE